MSKNISAPLLRTARLLDLVPFLNTHQGIALKDLAQHFDVTTAQMSADLMTLWMCGLPGYTPLELMDLEFESGFVTIKNASTLAKPRTITFQEGVALLLGLDLLKSSLPEDRDDLLTAIDSLRERLTKMVGVPIKLSVKPSTSASLTTSIMQAIQVNGGLHIRYHSLYKDQVTDRSVLPIDLYDLEGNQYMRAFCFNAQDYREFRVDRIESAIPASVSSDFVIQKIDSEKINFSISCKSPSRDVSERFAISDMPLNVSIELSSFSRQWIERSVMASGGSVVLNHPVDIRADIAKKAQLMLNRYKEA
jgi:proteasome accessory factor C